MNQEDINGEDKPRQLEDSEKIQASPDSTDDAAWDDVVEFSVSFPGTIYTVGCQDGKPATLQLDEEPRVPADKWFRRPIDANQVRELLNRFTEALGELTGESAGAAVDREPGRTSTMTLGAAFDDGTYMRADFRNPPDDISDSLYSVFCKAFESVELPSADGFAGYLDHLETFAYLNGVESGDWSTATKIWKSNDAYQMTHRLASYDEKKTLPKMAVELTVDEERWRNLLEAIGQADLSRWNSIYNGSEGWWNCLELLFGNGWGIRILGEGNWDSRCLPLMRFLASQGIGDDLLVSLVHLAEQEEDIAAVIEAIRNTPQGGWLDQELPFRDYRDSAGEAIEQAIRMRAALDGFLIERCDVSDTTSVLGKSRGIVSSGNGKPAPTAPPDYQGLLSELGMVFPEAFTSLPPYKNRRDVALGEDLLDRIYGKTVSGYLGSKIQHREQGLPLPTRKVSGIVHPIRELPSEDETLGIRYMRVSAHSGKFRLDVPHGTRRQDALSPEEREEGAMFAHQVLPILRQCGNLDWNNTDYLVAQNSTIAPRKTSSNGSPFFRSPWLIDIIWEDGTETFSHADMVPEGGDILCARLLPIMLGIGVERMETCAT